MEFFKKLLISQKEKVFVEIGEIGSCPYCNKKIRSDSKSKEKMPSL